MLSNTSKQFHDYCFINSTYISDTFEIFFLTSWIISLAKVLAHFEFHKLDQQNK